MSIYIPHLNPRFVPQTGCRPIYRELHSFPIPIILHLQHLSWGCAHSNSLLLGLKMKISVLVLCFTVFFTVMLSHAPKAESLDCNPEELRVCTDAVLQSEPPSAECCSKLKEQEPCFCNYKENPKFASFIADHDITKLSACPIPVPNCWVIVIFHNIYNMQEMSLSQYLWIKSYYLVWAYK